MERLRSIARAFALTRQADPKLVPLVAGLGLGTLALCVAAGVVFDAPVVGTVTGVLLGLALAMIAFGRRASASALAQIEGKPGAAAAVLQSMRGPWRVTPAVGFSRKQDLVHRVVGRPGVVLVGEGAPARVQQLLKQEKRRMTRVLGDVPVHEVSVGNGDGQVPLGRLQLHLTKLPRALKPKQVGPLETRLSALSTTDVPLPKGPMPRSPRAVRRR